MNSGLKMLRVRQASILVILVLAGLAITVNREPILRAAGWALVASEPISPVDIVVISLDSGGAGALEAADLVQSGIAKRVAVFIDPPTGEDHEFIRRGLPYEDAGARQVRQLRSLGVTDIVQIARIEGTESQGHALAAWSSENQFGSIAFVATTDHSRRAQRVLGRAFEGYRTKIMIQPARHSSFDPDRWWESRGGIRIAIIESQKLLLDIVLHPGLPGFRWIR